MIEIIPVGNTDCAILEALRQPLEEVVSQQAFQDEYAIYYTTDPGPTVSALPTLEIKTFLFTQY